MYQIRRFWFVFHPFVEWFWFAGCREPPTPTEMSWLVFVGADAHIRPFVSKCLGCFVGTDLRAVRFLCFTFGLRNGVDLRDDVDIVPYGKWVSLVALLFGFVE